MMSGGSLPKWIRKGARGAGCMGPCFKEMAKRLAGSETFPNCPGSLRGLQGTRLFALLLPVETG